jgi:hypothetical protein
MKPSGARGYKKKKRRAESSVGERGRINLAVKKDEHALSRRLALKASVNPTSRNRYLVTQPRDQSLISFPTPDYTGRSCRTRSSVSIFTWSHDACDCPQPERPGSDSLGRCARVFRPLAPDLAVRYSLGTIAVIIRQR